MYFSSLGVKGLKYTVTWLRLKRSVQIEDIFNLHRSQKRQHLFGKSFFLRFGQLQ